MHDIKLMIKHTFKESYKSMLILNGIVLGSLFLIALFILLFNASFFKSSVGVFFVMMGGFVIVLLIYATIGGIIYTAYKIMNQKLFSNEGYLTFTLPVSVDSLIISRIVVVLVWALLLIVVTLLGVGMIVGATMLKNLEDIIGSGFTFDWTSIFKGGKFIDIVAMIFNLIVILISSIVGLLFFLNILVFVNTGTLKKGKTAVAIIIYVFGIEILLFILNYIILFLPIGVVYDYELSKYVFSVGFAETRYYLINFTSLVVYGGAMVGLYFLARFMLKKKIELI